MPFHSTAIFTLAYLLPLSLAHLPQQKTPFKLAILYNKSIADAHPSFLLEEAILYKVVVRSQLKRPLMNLSTGELITWGQVTLSNTKTLNSLGIWYYVTLHKLVLCFFVLMLLLYRCCENIHKFVNDIHLRQRFDIYQLLWNIYTAKKDMKEIILCCIRLLINPKTAGNAKVLSTVVTDALVVKHQAISVPSFYYIFTVLDLFHT